jgi:hypothetical protein
MAFFHAELRDDILPNDSWRQLWQQSCQLLAPRQACYLIVGALELAAIHDNESEVEATLRALLNDEPEPGLLMLQKRLGLASTELPEEARQRTQQHDLSGYDCLLAQTGDLS